MSATTRRDNFDVSLRALEAIAGTVKSSRDAPLDRIGPHSWALVEMTQTPEKIGIEQRTLPLRRTSAHADERTSSLRLRQ
ncbi:hypothetical protein Ais01nite_74580 [Asanoa ishikariensis]|nr:hypothetical protein Ais01nite_74580 [Asanoa ishikariensis]